MFTSIMQAIFISFVPIAQGFGVLKLTLIIIVSFVIDICVCIYQIADIFIVTQLVKKEELASANGLMQVSLSLGQAIGPLLAGIVIVGAGIFNSAWINTSIFFLLIFTFVLLKQYKEPNQKNKNITPRLLIRNSLEGLRYTFNQVILRRLLIWQALFNFGIHGCILMVLVHLKGPLGLSGKEIGLVITCTAIGGMIGGLIFQFLYKNLKANVLLFTSSFITGTSFLLYIYSANTMVLGLANGLIMLNVVIVSRLVTLFIQVNTPDELLGRVHSSSRLISSVLASMSVLMMGIISENISTYFAFEPGANIVIVNSLLVFILLWKIDLKTNKI